MKAVSRFKAKVWDGQGQDMGQCPDSKQRYRIGRGGNMGRGCSGLIQRVMLQTGEFTSKMQIESLCAFGGSYRMGRGRDS